MSNNIAKMGLGGNFAKVATVADLPDIQALDLLNGDGNILDGSSLKRIDPNGLETDIGIVGKDYVNVTPRDLAQMWERVTGAEPSVRFYSGDWFSFARQLPSIHLGDTTLDTYMYTFGAMGGKGGIHTFFSNLNLWCLNLIVAAMKEAREIYTVRHVGNANEEAEAWMRGLHAQSHSRVQIIEGAYTLLANTKIDDDQFTKMTEIMHPYSSKVPAGFIAKPGQLLTPDMVAGKHVDDLFVEKHTGKKSAYNKNIELIDRHRSEITALWTGEKKLEMPEDQDRDSAWAALQAATQYHTQRNSRGDNLLKTLHMGTDRGKSMQRAFEVLFEDAQLAQALVAVQGGGDAAMPADAMKSDHAERLLNAGMEVTEHPIKSVEVA